MSYKIGSRRAQDIASGQLAKERVEITQYEDDLEAVLDLGDLQPSNVIMGDFTISLDQDPASDKEAARKAYVDAEVATEKARAEAAEAAIQADVDQNEADCDAGLSSATSDRAAIRSEFASADTALQSSIDTEKGRIDAILDSASTDSDTFAEVVSLINSVDLTNDNALAAAITSINADVAAVQSDVDQNESDADAALSSATSDRAAIRSEFASADTALQSAIDAVQADVDQNESDADAGLSSATSDRAAIRSEFAAADSSLQSAINAVQADVDQNESDADAGFTAATADRAAVRSEFAAADTSLQTALQANIDTEKARLDVLEGDSSTSGSVAKAIADVIDAAPEALNTLKELSDALGDDADFATTITNSVATVQTNLDTFAARTDNPHSVTPAQLSLVVGTDVQAYDQTLQGLAGAYHPGGGSFVPVMYSYSGGEASSVSYYEHGSFNKPVAEPVQSMFLGGTSETMSSLSSKYHLLNTSGIVSGTGTFELTLPAISDSDDGKVYVFKGDGMQDAGGNDVDVKISCNAADSIDGGSDFTMNDTYQSIFLLASKDNGWFIV